MGPKRSIRKSKGFHHGEGREPRRVGRRAPIDACHLIRPGYARRPNCLPRPIAGSACSVSPCASWFSAFSVVNLACLIAGHARPKTEGVANTTLTHRSIDNHGPKCVYFKAAQLVSTKLVSMGGSLSFD